MKQPYHRARALVLYCSYCIVRYQQEKRLYMYDERVAVENFTLTLSCFFYTLIITFQEVL